MYINIERSYNYVESVVFNHDGTKIVSGSLIKQYVWNVDTGECILTLEGHIDEVFSVDWS